MRANSYGNHTLVVGPTGTGKTMRVILPYILNAIEHNDMFVVADGKNKLLNKVYNNMVEKGYRIVTINMRDSEGSHSWNPLWEPYRYFLRGDMDNCLEMLNDLASNIMLNQVLGETSDPFWAISAKNMFVGLALALFEEPDADKSMINLKSIYCMSVKGFEKIGGTTFLHQYLKNKPEDSTVMINMASVLNAPNETRSSILAVFYQKLYSFITKESFWDKLCRNEIDLNQTCTSKTGVFLIYEDEKAETTRLITVFIKQLFQTYMRKKLWNSGENIPKFHLILDDFNSFSYFEGMENMLLAARERDISILFSVNSISLLKKIYGKAWVTFLYNNCNQWVIFRNAELKFMRKLVKQIKLFYGIEEFSMEKLTEKEGMAVVVGDRGKVVLEELNIPEYTEQVYYKENILTDSEYSVFKLEKYVREEMQAELNSKIGNKEKTPVSNVDEIIARIDKKIKQLEEEEKQAKEQEREKEQERISKLSKKQDAEILEEELLFKMRNELPKSKFAVYDEKQQKEVEMDILFTFESEETEKKYIVYTDNSEDEKGNVRVYSNIMIEDEEGIKLESITTEREYKIIEIILEQIQDEIHKNLNE